MSWVLMRVLDNSSVALIFYGFVSDLVPSLSLVCGLGNLEDRPTDVSE